jgi:hypothetical protein
MFIYPENTTGTYYATRNTNLIISFDLGGQYLYSFLTNNNSKIDITNNASLFTITKGCTVHAIADPKF